jgi:hypothetical protein
MQSPLVTRRHHDAEVEALRSEIVDLVDGLIEVSNDLTLTKQSLRAAIDALSGANEKANYAFRLASERFDYKVPLCDSMIRLSLQKADVGPQDRALPYQTFYMRLDSLALNFILQPHRRDIPYVIEHVAAKWGIAYGNQVQNKVREFLKQELNK